MKLAVFNSCKKRLLYSCIAAMLFSAFRMLNAQPVFIAKGKVEYEKKQNMKVLLGSGFWGEEMRSKLPQFRSTFFDLYFNEKESCYKPGKEVDEKFKGFWNDLAAENWVYNNYETNQTAQQKQIWETRFLLKDSMLNIEWKITEETRKIAGFECRKAIGRMLDTVVVVAFYTDEIITPGGPESFGGLPGLILGVAFPRMHTTWFATKLELQEVKPTNLQAPVKGKATTRKDLIKTVFTAMKGWDKAGQNLLEMLF